MFLIFPRWGSSCSLSEENLRLVFLKKLFLKEKKACRAASFGWDVKPRSSLCSTPNMDYKNPDVTEEENMWFVTPCKHLEKRDTWAPGSTPRTLFQSRDLEQYNIQKNMKQKKIWTNEPYVLPTVKNIWVWAALFWF